MSISFKHESLTIAPNEHIVRWIVRNGQEIGYIYSWRPYDKAKNQVYDPTIWKMKLFFDASSFVEQTLGPDTPSRNDLLAFEEAIATESIPNRDYNLTSRRQMIDAGKEKPVDNSVYLIFTIMHHDVNSCIVFKDAQSQFLQGDGSWGRHFEFESIKYAQQAMRLAGLTTYKEQEAKITYKTVDLQKVEQEDWLTSLGWDHVMTEEDGCDTWAYPWDLRNAWPQWAREKHGTQHYWDTSEALELQKRIDTHDITD